MKKIIILLFVIASIFPVFADYNAVQPLTGYIYSNVTFSITIFEEYLPFDLTNSDYAEDSSSPTYAKGVNIGSYTLSSTSTVFKLYVTHDKLTLVDRTFGIDDGTLSEIDYYLYMQMGSSTTFACCLSDTAPDVDVSGGDSLSFTNKILIEGSIISKVNLLDQNLYICLYDHNGGETTAETVEKLMNGTYSSNIYFYLEV